VSEHDYYHFIQPSVVGACVKGYKSGLCQTTGDVDYEKVIWKFAR